MDDNYSDELTLKELIIKIQDYAWAILKNWWIVVIFCAITIGGFLYIHYSSHMLYGARMKFVVEGQKGTGGGIANILGSMGMGKSAGGTVNPYKLLEVFQGTELFMKVMARKMENGNLIGNELIELYDLRKKWAEGSPSLANYKFTVLGALDDTDIIKQKVIKSLRYLVLGSETNRSSAITTLSLDEEIGIYKLSSGSRSEAVSLALTDAYYEEIKVFFQEEVFSDQIQIAEILDAKRDSLQAARNYTIRQLAKFENRNRAVIGKDLLAERTIITMEIQAMNTAYASVMKNSEMTDINRRNQKPLFVAVDRPFKPLSAVGSSLKKKVQLGFAIGIFLSFLFIIIRKMYRDIMST